MGKRKCIGLIYSYNENWIGGTYYIENIVAALNSLDDSQKPFLKIYTTTNDEFNSLIKKTEYPYTQFISLQEKYNLHERIINKCCRILINKNVITRRAKNSDFDFVFPNPRHHFFSNVSEEKKVHWIPDFQEDYLPQFFSNEEIISRKKLQSNLANTARHIVFSSNDACNDFIRLYPESKVNKIILPFAVKPTTLISNEECNHIMLKYSLSTPFFLIPNQLWAHKNHLTVIKAAEILITKGIQVQFVFTGKDSDYRFPDYPATLYDRVKKTGLTEQIKFLGFIPKVDVNALAQVCIAIIQPSLFEGWSTVIEEAKCMNKFIFASNISIHLEQLATYPNKILFANNNAQNLAEIIKLYIDKPSTVENYRYEKDFKKFGNAILEIL